MELQKTFSDYGLANPGLRRELRRISLALCRTGITTMEKLADTYRLVPDQLLLIRDIGQTRLDLIGEILQVWQAGTEPESR